MEGGETALEENEETLRKLEQRSKQLEGNKKATQVQLDSLKNDITKQQVCDSVLFQV